MKISNNKYEAKALKDVLRDVIDQKHLKNGVVKIRVCDSWIEVMGLNIQKYTNKVDFSKQILYVSLRSAPLKMELNYNIDMIKNKLNSNLGAKFIKKIVLT